MISCFALFLCSCLAGRSFVPACACSGATVVEPRQVLKELGTDLPGDITIRVHDSLADLRYLVIPRRPDATEGWSEMRLASIVSRDCMIGVANPKVLANE